MSTADEAGDHRYEVGERSGVKITVRLVELTIDQARRLRHRQLETIVRLLRRASKSDAGALDDSIAASYTLGHADEGDQGDDLDAR